MPDGGIASVAAPVVGGLLGGGSKGSGGSQTQQVKLDPRMEQILYGNYTGEGILGDVNKLFKDQFAQGGMHPLQTAGLEAQRQVLTHPTFTQGYNDMRSLGLGLMGGGVARNPLNGGGGGGSSGGGILGGAGPIRPYNQGFGYDLASGNLSEVMRPISAWQPAQPAQPDPAAGGGDLTQAQFDQMYREYMRRREMEQNAGPGNGSY